MKASQDKLFTPIYLKLTDDMPWPAQESAFYLMTGNGLYMCRNTPFFRSSVPAREWPAELAKHRSSIRLNYPKVPQTLFERIIGFFALIGERHGAEAAALLVWNRESRQVEAIVPPQTATVGKGWTGRPYPIDVSYDVPPLAPNQVMIGDIHSHVDGPAYTSKTDADDEAHRPGIHIVIGRIFTDPPEIQVEVTVDGHRFSIDDESDLIEGYDSHRADEVPAEWIEQVEVSDWYSSYNDDYGYSGGGGYYSSSGGYSYTPEYGTSTTYRDTSHLP